MKRIEFWWKTYWAALWGVSSTDVRPRIADSFAAEAANLALARLDEQAKDPRPDAVGNPSNPMAGRAWS